MPTHSLKQLFAFFIRYSGMKQLYSLTIVFLLSLSYAHAQKVNVVKFEELKRLISRPNDTTYIVNFWATWCRPCIAELPNFEQIHASFQSQKVKVLLISMDFAKDLSTKVIPFIQRKQMKASVWLLNETDYDRFIEQVDKTWSGAIPATLILNNASRKRKFFEKELSYEALAKEIQDFL